MGATVPASFAFFSVASVGFIGSLGVTPKRAARAFRFSSSFEVVAAAVVAEVAGADVVG